MFSKRPVLRLSITRTDAPRAASVSAICEPMKPAPPVTRAMPERAMDIRYFRLRDRLSESNPLLLEAAPLPPERRQESRRALPSDANVFESQLAHVGRLVYVAQVRDPWCLHQTANALHVQGAKLIPLGHEDQHLSPRSRRVLVLGVLDLRQEPLHRGLRHGVVGADRGPAFDQSTNDVQRWRFTDIIGFRFECQAKHGDSLSHKSAGQLFNLWHHRLALLLVDFDHGIDDSRLARELLRNCRQRPRIFWKT